MTTKKWWVIGPHSDTPMFFEGQKCKDHGGNETEKDWFFKGPNWIGVEGKTCFETQKAAQEQVIKRLKDSIANTQSNLADAEKKLLDIEEMNKGNRRAVEVYFVDNCDTKKVTDQLIKAGLIIAKINNGYLEGFTNDMSKLYIDGIAWITLS